MKAVSCHFSVIPFVFARGHLQQQAACLSLHLCGLFQVQPGLTDNPLGVLQLRLELTVFSGDLFKQLRQTTQRTSK